MYSISDCLFLVCIYSIKEKQVEACTSLSLVEMINILSKYLIILKLVILILGG